MLPPMRTLPPLLVALVLLAGCPTVKLTSVDVKEGSVSATGLTLSAKVTVEETEAVEPGAEASNEGRAVVGLYLPMGWTVAAARVKSPQESTARRLVPVPQSAVQFAETFPQTPGQWWAFASNTQSVATGSWVHDVELDLTFPKKTKAGELGMSVSVLQETMDEVAAPLIYDVTVKGKKATLKARAFEGKALPAADPAAGNSDKASAG